MRLKQRRNKMFARKNDDGNYDIFENDGSAATKIDANVYPVGSSFSARYEHADGIVLTPGDVEKLKIEISL